jgi:hypothetical protein
MLARTAPGTSVALTVLRGDLRLPATEVQAERGERRRLELREQRVDDRGELLVAAAQDRAERTEGDVAAVGEDGAAVGDDVVAEVPGRQALVARVVVVLQVRGDVGVQARLDRVLRRQRPEHEPDRVDVPRQERRVLLDEAAHPRVEAAVLAEGLVDVAGRVVDVLRVRHAAGEVVQRLLLRHRRLRPRPRHLVHLALRPLAEGGDLRVRLDRTG